jgi:hypothetical protein
MLALYGLNVEKSPEKGYLGDVISCPYFYTYSAIQNTVFYNICQGGRLVKANEATLHLQYNIGMNLTRAGRWSLAEIGRTGCDELVKNAES